ncbi:TPM domain-containing protein [Chitinophaga nivalis]|uniref:TPM domain-containing protein n=1 Tax=Chitinophaga nivalis TaxID=2991709 RepID=A0ABT3IWZ9_9BACT|nr:TPM domain-containing protein [Chitinophaga nivalis]MCW3461812.1 TPM domain-containing protein [Chitinophaga nivalis]MCW3488494.1 TPM domain-containing protein [Chitinophaga nivalis]
MRILRWFLPGLLMIAGLLANAQQIPPRPNPPTLVNDFTGTLLKNEEDALEQKLVTYYDSTSTQIAVVILKSVGDYDISQVSLKILRDWGIGTKGKNNGVLLLIALDDRKLRIETGYGMEGAIPDAVANEIISRILKPAFREKHYYEGLDAATDALIKAAAGEYRADPRQSKPGIGVGTLFLLIMVIVIIISIISRGGGGGGRGGGTTYNRRGGWIWPVIGGLSGFGSGSRGGGWSGGDSGGGGFGGFGGGSGGGGGASGSW